MEEINFVEVPPKAYRNPLQIELTALFKKAAILKEWILHGSASLIPGFYKAVKLFLLFSKRIGYRPPNISYYFVEEIGKNISESDFG